MKVSGPSDACTIATLQNPYRDYGLNQFCNCLCNVVCGLINERLLYSLDEGDGLSLDEFGRSIKRIQPSGCQGYRREKGRVRVTIGSGSLEFRHPLEMLIMDVSHQSFIDPEMDCPPIR